MNLDLNSAVSNFPRSNLTTFSSTQMKRNYTAQKSIVFIAVKIATLGINHVSNERAKPRKQSPKLVNYSFPAWAALPSWLKIVYSPAAAKLLLKSRNTRCERLVKSIFDKVLENVVVVAKVVCDGQVGAQVRGQLSHASLRSHRSRSVSKSGAISKWRKWGWADAGISSSRGSQKIATAR